MADKRVNRVYECIANGRLFKFSHQVGERIVLIEIVNNRNIYVDVEDFRNIDKFVFRYAERTEV